jgi:hypothetical protein
MSSATNTLESPVPASSPDGRAAAPAWVGWVPAGVVAAGSVALLLWTGVGVWDLLRFSAYVLGAIVVPGTLLWRALRGGAGLIAVDLSAGAALGYALEVLAYIPARAVGLPLLVLVCPAAIIASFVGVPRLRRFWAGSGVRVPLWWGWALATVVGFVVIWSAASVFALHGLTWPGNATPYVDMPFQLALAGELKHHMPPQIPYLTGEPLNYHWFVYSDLASTSWVTGIELQTLLYRLSLLPVLIAFTILIASLARTVTGAWWTGPAAAAATYVAVVPSLYAWTDSPATEGAILTGLWVSPTQTFGALLFVPVVLLLVELLRPGDKARERSGGRLILLAIFLAAVAGGKATFLPILLGALFLVGIADLLVTRRLNRVVLAAAGLTAVCTAFAQLVLFGGASGGLVVRPLATVNVMAVASTTQLARLGTPLLSVGTLAALVICLACWLLGWAGVIGLGARRRYADRAIMLLVGLALAGVGAAVIIFFHPSGSQIYFFESARPYLAVAAVAGFANVLPPLRSLSRRAWWALAAAASVGVLGVFVIRELGPGRVPTVARYGVAGAVALLSLPYVAAAALAVAVGLAVARLSRGRPALRGLAFGAALVVLAAMSLPDAVARIVPTAGHGVRYALRIAPSPAAANANPKAIPEGGVEAARWLRDHSSPDDLVATNTHCHGVPAPNCDSRNFWVSAYTERRVLIEGWDYTGTMYAVSAAKHLPHIKTPYWDPALLAANDAAFTSPSADTIGKLRDQYGVSWLLVDTRISTPPAALAQFATLRYRSGLFDVYSIP